MAAVVASSTASVRLARLSRPAQRPARSLMVVRATAATEEKVEAKAEAKVEAKAEAAAPAPAAKAEAAPAAQQTAAPAPAAQKASAPPSVRRPHSTASTYGERLPTDPLGEASYTL